MLRIIDLILGMFQLGNVELRVIGQVAVHLSVDRRDHARTLPQLSLCLRSH